MGCAKIVLEIKGGNYMVKRVGVLTSGGDAPGMNACLRAIIRSGLYQGLEMYVIYNGYKGIIDRKIEKVDRSFVSEIINRGGTKIGTARLPEFVREDVQDKAVSILHEYKIDALVTIGGDGTYRGALALSRKGINCIAVPGTIDNDVASTDFTIGFDTALNTIVECVDKLRDTSSSHQRCSVIEVMGRYCGDLAIYAGIACGAEIVVTKDHLIPKEELKDSIRQQIAEGKHHIMVIITEKLTDVKELAREIERDCGIEARSEVLGRIQRGGTPSGQDRVRAARLGVFAIDLLIQGKTGMCVGCVWSKLTATPIEEALAMVNKNNGPLIRVSNIIK